ncbi:MAG: glycosyltransferase family 4 protein [Brockia lithotrophica]|nr:glycosyltransferase family 4 protein [Brockia lithotrophica]
MRVALVTNIVSPYRLPVWDIVGKGVDHLHIFFCAERAPNRIWEIKDLNHYDFEYSILPGIQLHFNKRDLSFYLNSSLWYELKKYRPTHLIVTGYETPSYLIAIAYAKLHRIRLVIWWGSHALSSRSRRGFVALLRKHILRFADAYVTYGTRATDYLIEMGIPDKRIVTGINTVDVERVAWLVKSFRSQMGPRTNGRVKFLYVGQLIERKGVRQFLRAFRALPKEKAELTIVGYGPLEGELKIFVKDNFLDNVTFAGGTRTLEETARYYAQADVLVMPSFREVWGLVVNEALASGLWVLSSKYAGATFDLIEKAPPMSVGESFDPTNENEFIDVLFRALDISPRRNVDFISSWGLKFSPIEYGNAILSALRKTGDQI